MCVKKYFKPSLYYTTHCPVASSQQLFDQNVGIISIKSIFKLFYSTIIRDNSELFVEALGETPTVVTDEVYKKSAE